MKKTVFAFLAVSFIFSSTVNAQNNDPVQGRGGYTGPTVPISTVKKAKSFRDDTPVVLEGKIRQSIGANKYFFADSTGEIVIEIDRDDWRGVTVGENDVVVIYGEVDRGFSKVTIEVDRIEKKL